MLFYDLRQNAVEGFVKNLAKLGKHFETRLAIKCEHLIVLITKFFFAFFYHYFKFREKGFFINPNSR